MLIPDAIQSHPSKQQITNLIKYGVATGVAPTYNTTNSPNKLLTRLFLDVITNIAQILIKTKMLRQNQNFRNILVFSVILTVTFLFF